MGEVYMNTVHANKRERRIMLIKLAAEHRVLSDELEEAYGHRAQELLAEMVVNEAAMAKLIEQGVKV